MDRDLVWVLVYDSFFLLKELLNTHTYKKEILFLSFILCHVYHRRKKMERNHFSTAVFFITKLLHIEITPNYLK